MTPTAAHLPDFETFQQLAAGAGLVPVYRRLVGDSLTPGHGLPQDRRRPLRLPLRERRGRRKGRPLQLSGRRSVLRDRGLRPSGDDQRLLGRLGRRNADAGHPAIRVRKPAWKNSAAGSRRSARCILPELPPFCSGAVGYAGYDTVRYIEHLPNAPADDRQVPDLAFAFYDQMVVFDNVTKAIVVVAMARLDRDCPNFRRENGTVPLWPRPTKPPAAASIGWSKSSPTPQDNLQPFDIRTSGDVSLPYESNFAKADFEAAVRKCVEYIRAGDIFQVVLSQRLKMPLRTHPFEIYRTLRVVNPSPFMFYVRTPSVTLVGSSPEVMVRVVDGQVTVRPLAGTRPRGKTEEEDRRLAEELLADPKERAEHVMLVDLGRNDVGRVADFRSVEVTDVMTIERYSHVMHITSNVSGHLAPGRSAFDALQVCLPAGTVSGAPKVRAMEIIDELEPCRRGPYGGAVGYVDFAGNMDTCIALRTIVIHDDTAYVQAGAGLVADSVPENEWNETLNKARGLLKAIELAEGRGD